MKTKSETSLSNKSGMALVTALIILIVAFLLVGALTLRIMMHHGHVMAYGDFTDG